jgi:hypothetical protein
MDAKLGCAWRANWSSTMEVYDSLQHCAVYRIPPLLSEPPASFAGLRNSGGGAALSLAHAELNCRRLSRAVALCGGF